ncbi:MAG: conjugal transfer protein [Lachnospiraceae bacterium]|nr:conjugal transfer protein [Lachnospiraceae bacterium]
MKAVVTDRWILCPVCKAKTRTQILDDTELKHFPLFCPKCKEKGSYSGLSIHCQTLRRRAETKCFLSASIC